MKPWVEEAFRYLAASACALSIDVGVLFILVHYFSWWYLGAATISFLVGLAVAYALSVSLVFKYRRLKDRRLEFASFGLIGAGGVAINAAVIFAGVRYLGLHYLIAKCVAAVFTFGWNFGVRRQFLFVKHRAT